MVIKQRKSSNKVSDKYSLEKQDTQVLNPDKITLIGIFLLNQA